MSGKPHVLVIVQNLPVPLDRRVWLECRALKAAGYDVTVICPKGPGDPAREVIDGVRIFKYRPAPQASGVLGYLVEFVYCWLRTARLSVKAWRTQRFDVLQACNPPDTYWLLARFWKRRGVKFVFDQHDLNPELFLSRFGTPTSRLAKAQLSFLTWLERKTYETADHVISTNRSYQRIAIERGGFDPADTTVVRSGPDTTVMRPVHPAPGIGPRTRHSLAYLGIMGPQDGVDTILDVMHELVDVRGRQDVEATLMGFGDCYEELRRQCTALGLDDVVTFTGRADAQMIAEHLSAATIGLCPDLKTPLNDVSTMNKTMEYMAYALPSVSFDLVETRVSGADACVYVPSGDVSKFCDAIELLLDDPEYRFTMARKARARVSSVLDWKPQSEAYVSVFDRLVRPDAVPAPAAAELSYVDLDREAEFRRFVLARGPLPVTDHALGA
jgi:glycosyltransferase involved in cell wall biosynthesis